MNNVFSPPIGSLRVGNNTEACFNNILKALNTSIPVVGLLLLGELLIRDKAWVSFFSSFLTGPKDHPRDIRA